ncbi:hypothetical protein [Klebsiella michiganensis]|uniref:hypothetical protein n=1 Tax=Klebsiella michiganensis TaxID=1134687 RepID=UPI0034D20F09
MTDITELTQLEINDALAQLKQISEYPTPSTQYARVLRRYILALVEALEKAQQRIGELESKLANPVQLPKTNGYWTETEKAYEQAITIAKRQIRLAGFRCEGDE